METGPASSLADAGGSIAPVVVEQDELDGVTNPPFCKSNLTAPPPLSACASPLIPLDDLMSTPLEPIELALREKFDPDLMLSFGACGNSVEDGGFERKSKCAYFNMEEFSGDLVEDVLCL